MIIMSNKEVGVLISKKRWRKLLKGKKDLEIKEYIQKGQESGLGLSFFCLETVDVHKLTCDVAQIVNNKAAVVKDVLLPRTLYNGRSIFSKNNIRKWRYLSQNKEITVINEFHRIKQNDLLDILAVFDEAKPFLEQDLNDNPIVFCAFGQKKGNSNWQITATYAKRRYSAPMHWEEAISQRLNEISDTTINKAEFIEELNAGSQAIFNCISNFYPGIYETGLVFTINNTGKVCFTDIKTRGRVIKELLQWDKDIWKATVRSSLDIASYHLFKRDRISPTRETIMVKFVEINEEIPIIRLPNQPDRSFIDMEQEQPIKFGLKQINCKLEKKGDGALWDSTDEEPMEIEISTPVIKFLHLPLEPIYQLKFAGDFLEIGPTIGFLLGDKNQLYKPKYMKKYSDRLGIYPKLGGLYIAFSPRSVNWEENIVYGLIYNPKKKAWVYRKVPIPAAIYRRNFHQDVKTIHMLNHKTNNRLFNSERFTKLDLYKRALLNSALKKHIPETHLLTNVDKLLKFIDTKTKVILKPAELSRGRGIMVIEKKQDLLGETVGKDKEYLVYDYREKFDIRHHLNKGMLLELLKQSDILDINYLYQEYIPLMRVNNCAFDVRIVMQKNEEFKWGCSGIECRVAKSGTYITNIARGGVAMTLEDLVKNSAVSINYEELNDQIMSICYKFCDWIDMQNGHFSEFGIDVGLDENGYPWLIEANVFPSFKGFKSLDYNHYLDIRYQPLIYATKIQGFAYHREVMK